MRLTLIGIVIHHVVSVINSVLPIGYPDHDRTFCVFMWYLVLILYMGQIKGVFGTYASDNL